MISLKTHNILDYVVVLLLMAMPRLAGLSTIPAASSFFFWGGLGLFIYSLFTNYQYSIASWIPLELHMGLDVVLGILTIFAPYIFGYSGEITSGQNAAHAAVGGGLILLVAFTRRRSLAARMERIFDTQTDKVA